MNTQTSVATDSISTSFVAHADRPSGIRLTLVRAPDARIPQGPPERPQLLRASQVEAVAADEIDWLYEHTDDETDPTCVEARAAIEGWLSELSPEEQLVIALHHSPLGWPEHLAGHEDESYALVLHLLRPSGPRDLAYSTEPQLTARARRRLEIGHDREGPRRLKTLRRRARWLFEDAVRAYAEVRGRGPSLREKRHEALTSLERTVPAAYAWARFSAPELALRVTGADTIATARRLCTAARVCILGPSQAGKTSLAVAMLRRRVWESAVLAAFVPAHRLGVARIQHAAGHGEPEIVTRAMTAPIVLLDDLGCERDTATNPVPDVIFERHDANRPTWVTTGFTPEQLVKRYGTGAVRRLFANASVIRLEDPKPHAAR